MTIWNRLEEELTNWDQEGLRPARLWLRDDDAVEPTNELETLLGLSRQFDVPTVLAVIPALVSYALADRVKDNKLVSIAVHGHAHINHAPEKQKKCELGLHRDKQIVLDELAAGRAKLVQMFGDRFINMLVPPWNRIDAELVISLASIGLTTLSTFGWQNFPASSGLLQHNTHVDIIDWKGTRGGRPVNDLVIDLAETLSIARQQGGAPVGILSHHLVHDENAWKFLDQLCHFVSQNDHIKWCQAVSLPDGSIG